MGDEFGNDFVTIMDDDGNEFELEHLDTAEIGGEIYMAFVPADMDEDDEDFGLVILKVVAQDGEDVFATVDDEVELQAAYDLFTQRLSDDDDFDDEDVDEDDDE
ncbi:MAG: DUF1292 domain-containing protein [Oscillospiraceae bacterium]|nr:DUF1292 domain-containing protein [Oscillospiraceae bacterium]